jgi:hypothetical protein
MTSRKAFVALFGVLALGTAAAFFALSIDRGVYAPGAWEIHENEELGRIRARTPQRFKGDVNSFRILRKLYSVVAFAIVGFFAAPLFRATRRVLATALAIAAFSTAIEVAQRLTGAHESRLSNAFDIACGALGGLLGALLFNAFAAPSSCGSPRQASPSQARRSARSMPGCWCCSASPRPTAKPSPSRSPARSWNCESSATRTAP